MRTAVLCPTRGRREGLLRTHESLCRTSTHSTLIACVDEDDRDTYAGLDTEMFRLHFSYAPRVSIVDALNRAVQTFHGYDAYGYIVDDARFTNRWEDWLESVINDSPGRIVVASPEHNGGPWVNFPFVSRQWVKAAGWYACPDTLHFCWDTVAEMLGEATAIRFATKDEFFIEHDMLMAPDRPDMVEDAQSFLWWCVTDRKNTVRSLREAMAR